MLVLAIAVWSLIYFAQHFASPTFQEGAMGNLFATILGVIVGIPIALEINRRQQDAQQATALAVSQREESQRKQKVLALIRSELLQNKNDIIVRRKPITDGGKREVHTGSLRDEMWSAFSDGGELHYVNNPDVLASIAGAYYEIRSNIHLERGFMNAIHFPGIRVKQDKYPQDFFLEYITTTDQNLLAAIERAIAAIDAEITTTSSA